MRFNRPFQPSSIFTQMFTDNDKRYFASAYRKHDDKNKQDRRLPKDREWVEDVMLFWSEKMELPLALAVSMFQTGDYLAARRHYQRVKLPAANRTIESIRQSKVDDELKSSMMQEALKGLKDIELVCKWDDGDVANWCRATFVEALGTTHPSTRFDAHTKREKEKRQKVDNPMVVKSRQPKSEAAKRPRRKQEQQANAA